MPKRSSCRSGVGLVLAAHGDEQPAADGEDDDGGDELGTHDENPGSRTEDALRNPLRLIIQATVNEGRYGPEGAAHGIWSDLSTTVAIEPRRS